MKSAKLTFAATIISLTTSAQAETFHLTGEINYHKDIVLTYFTLNEDTSNVRIWTDSFEFSANFDPITALWSSDGTLIAANDDDPSIDPATQTNYDSGFNLSSIAAGDYVFSVATYPNWANGDNISDGFRYDSDKPIALEDWKQPANHLNMGKNWSVWLDGVSSASSVVVTPIPEPSTLALMLGGLGLVGLMAARSKKA